MFNSCLGRLEVYRKRIEIFLNILHQWERCTLYNPTSRLATGHRSTQNTVWGPFGWGGGAMENGWKQGGRRNGGVTDESPPPSNEGLISCCLRSRRDRVRKHNRRVNVFFHVVWVCVTLSVWGRLEVLAWATERCQMFLCEVEEGLAAGQSRAGISVIPFISLFLPSSFSCFSLCCCFHLQLWEKVELQQGRNGPKIGVGALGNEKLTSCLAVIDPTIQPSVVFVTSLACLHSLTC